MSMRVHFLFSMLTYFSFPVLTFLFCCHLFERTRIFVSFFSFLLVRSIHSIFIFSASLSYSLRAIHTLISPYQCLRLITNNVFTSDRIRTFPDFPLFWCLLLLQISCRYYLRFYFQVVNQYIFLYLFIQILLLIYLFIYPIASLWVNFYFCLNTFKSCFD